MNKFSKALIELNNSLKEIKFLQSEFNKNPSPEDGIWFEEERVSFFEMAYAFQDLKTFNDKTLILKDKIHKLISEYNDEIKLYKNIYEEKAVNCNKLINEISNKAISKIPEEVFTYTKAIRVNKKLNLDHFIIDKKLPYFINDYKTLVFVTENNANEIKNILFEEATFNMENESKQVKNNVKGLLNIENFIYKEKPDLEKVQMILEVLTSE